MVRQGTHAGPRSGRPCWPCRAGGTRGPGGLSGYEIVSQINGNALSVAAGDVRALQVDCPTGKKAIGGAAMFGNTRLILMGVSLKQTSAIAQLSNPTNTPLFSSVTVQVVCVNAS